MDNNQELLIAQPKIHQKQVRSVLRTVKLLEILCFVLSVVHSPAGRAHSWDGNVEKPDSAGAAALGSLQGEKKKRKPEGCAGTGHT